MKRQFNDRVYAPVLSIRPSYSTLYAERLDGGRQYTSRFWENTVNLKDNDTRGKISKKARLNIQCAIDWLTEAAQDKLVKRSSNNTEFRFRVNFVTLTLSASQFEEVNGSKRLRHTDQQIKSQILGPFLNTLRKVYNVRNYMWRAESQRMTGNIHFHLLTDRFIHWERLREIWNTAQEKLGYVSRFEAVHGHRNPNSTDVHSVRKISKLGAYLTKYMAKEGTGRKIEGRQWFLSESLSKLDKLKIYVDEIESEFTEAMKYIPEKLQKGFDYCKVLMVRADHWIQGTVNKIRQKMVEFLQPLVHPDDDEVYEV